MTCRKGTLCAATADRWVGAGPKRLELHEDVTPRFLPMARSRAWKTLAAARRFICLQGPFGRIVLLSSLNVNRILHVRLLSGLISPWYL